MQEIFQKIKTTPAITNKLAKINIHRYWDLLLNIPLRYEDLTKVYKIAEASVGDRVLIEGTIISCEILNRTTKQLQVKITDGNQSLILLFFHFYPSQVQNYTIGKQIRAFGEIKLDYFHNKSIIHPKIESVTDHNKLSNTFSPIYPTTQGLTQTALIKLVDEALVLPIYDPLPLKFIDKLNVPPLAKTITTLHKLTPKQFNKQEHQNALERIKLDELIAQQILMYQSYNAKHINKSQALIATHKYTKELIKNLPFKLTTAQKRVIQEIYHDIAMPLQMNRLLQGDVGSGKTIVATLAMLVAVENNCQACIIAPTEILAEQHYTKTKKLLANMPINIVWLSGSLKTIEKKLVYEQIHSGNAHIIVGTHAVFQKNVIFQNLALLVIDEQHRFGVEQRLSLQAKGDNPHQLMMSATPIPRTLAMSYYADLDVSCIDELPTGRTPIKTLLINNQRRLEVLQFVRHECSIGHQVYWVCPLIEESETLDLENAINTFNELSTQLSPLNVGLIHGRLSATEKAHIMQEFTTGSIQILVATIVIEVGVDVPNASIMVIEHAERMGLSQLHQLRGRVGRGINKSQCVLLYQNPLSEIAKSRLKIIHENTDGFEIARQDLLLRGPGELLGARQSGLPTLRFANLENDWELLPIAKDIAKELVQNYSDAANLYLQLWINENNQFLRA